MTPHTDSSKEIEIPKEFMAAQGKAAAEYKEQCKDDRDSGFLADCDFSEGAQWAYRHLHPSPSPSGWIELKKGCEMPAIHLDCWLAAKRSNNSSVLQEGFLERDGEWRDIRGGYVTVTVTHWMKKEKPALP